MIWLQTATEFWLVGGIISLSNSIRLGVNNVRLTEIHTAEPLLTEPSAFEVKKAIENLKSY